MLFLNSKFCCKLTTNENEGAVHTPLLGLFSLALSPLCPLAQPTLNLTFDFGLIALREAALLLIGNRNRQVDFTPWKEKP